MSVTYQREESIAVITMNDGKVNALGPDMLAAINAELDRAEGEDAGAVVIAGNDRVFSGGRTAPSRRPRAPGRQSRR